MATNEGDFKKEFRDALEHYHGKAIHIWTNNDMFRCGLPDFCVHSDGDLFAVEAKYVKAPPARPASKILSHELTPTQAEFLSGVQRTGGYGIILIGLHDIAVAVPFKAWSFFGEVPMTNITLERVRFLGGKGLSFPKKNGIWDVKDFLNNVRTYYEQA